MLPSLFESSWTKLNTPRPKHNDRHVADNIWNTFSWMKMYEFLIRFHWSLFLKVKLTIFHHWFRWWLGADQATSHYLNQWWLICWGIYASLCLIELKLSFELIKAFSNITVSIILSVQGTYIFRYLSTHISYSGKCRFILWCKKKWPNSNKIVCIKWHFKSLR